MVFSSTVFLFHFLPAVFLIGYFAKQKFANWFLIAGSFLFYAWGEPVYVLLMVFSVCMNWLIGKKAQEKAWMAAGVVMNTALLVVFKYTDFIIRTVNSIFGLSIRSAGIALPIGISFFTFQAISYLIDIYRKEAKAGTLSEVALYISFFPQLIAGPIVKYKEISEQIRSREITGEKFAEGFRRFIYGLAKKVLIANTLGQYADLVFGAASAGTRATWLGILCYTFQIYYDFSGYSDMAIGLGRMFGFTYSENFRYPYLSSSITEFWRRWHISLGTWFREYVYIPIGGNRKHPLRNLCVVFLLTGIWHGANITFVLWGLYHGALSLIERCALKKILDRHKAAGTVCCFTAVMIGWVLFRTDSLRDAVRYITQMFGAGTVDIIMPNRTLFTMVVAVFGAGLIQRAGHILKRWKGSVPEAIYCAFLLILSVAALANNTYNPFIYFQF